MTGRGLVLNIYGPLGSRVLNTIRQLSSPEHKEKVGGGGGGVACFLVYERIGLLSINVCAQIKSPFLTPPLCTGHVSYHTIYLMDPLMLMLHVESDFTHNILITVTRVILTLLHC